MNPAESQSPTMNVINVHHRRFPIDRRDELAVLIDGLASPEDRLWPHEVWPPMRLDLGLSIGAAGGHGPVRYHVIARRRSSFVEFRFDAPAGFDGTHRFEVIPCADGCELRHTLAMRPRGMARLSWPLLFRPLHDALIEDAMAKAESALGVPADVRPWSAWVRALRYVFARGRPRPQSALPDAGRALAK